VPNKEGGCQAWFLIPIPAAALNQLVALMLLQVLRILCTVSEMSSPELFRFQQTSNLLQKIKIKKSMHYHLVNRGVLNQS